MRTRRDESGAVAVEAALIIPLMVMMFAGIIEYGTMFRHGLSVSNAARQGARTAAVVGKTADADFRIVQSTLGSRGSLSTGDINAIIIYKADAANGDVPATCLSALTAGTAGVSGTCNIYRQSSGFLATTASLPWNPTTRANDMYNTRDYIGVYIATNFTSPLGITLRNRSVADRTVFRLDPGAEQPMTIGGTLPPISTTSTTAPPSTTTTTSASTTSTPSTSGPTTTRASTTTAPTTSTTRATTTTTRATTTTTRATTTTTRATTTTTRATTTTTRATTTTTRGTTTTTRATTTTTRATTTTTRPTTTTTRATTTTAPTTTTTRATTTTTRPPTTTTAPTTTTTRPPTTTTAPTTTTTRATTTTFGGGIF